MGGTNRKSLIRRSHQVLVAIGLASVLISTLPQSAWGATIVPTGPGTVVIGPQAMEGNLSIHPGDTIKAGYDFTMPGSHPAATVTDKLQPNATGTQGFNAYSYVTDNPTTLVDPTGELAVEYVVAPQPTKRATPPVTGTGIFARLALYAVVIGLGVGVGVDLVCAGGVCAPSWLAPQPFDQTNVDTEARNRDKSRAYVMRVQLQEGTLPDRTYGGPPLAGASPITVAQVRNALQQLYYGAANVPWYPNSGLPKLASAVVTISQKLGRYPPGGIRGTQRSFVKQEWNLPGRQQFRLDVDNLVGINLVK